MSVPKFPLFSWSQLPLGFSLVRLYIYTKISTIHLIPAPIQDSPRSVYVRTKISTILMIPAPFRVLFGPSLHLHQNFHHPLNPCPHSGFSSLRLCPYQNFHYSHDPSSPLGFSLVRLYIYTKISTIHLILPPFRILLAPSMSVPKFPLFSWSQLPLGFSLVRLYIYAKISTIHLIPAPIQDSPRSVYVRTKISTILMIPAPFRVLFGPSLHLHQNFHHPLDPCPHSGFSSLRLCPYQNFHYSHDPSSL